MYHRSQTTRLLSSPPDLHHTAAVCFGLGKEAAGLSSGKHRGLGESHCVTSVTLPPLAIKYKAHSSYYVSSLPPFQL